MNEGDKQWNVEARGRGLWWRLGGERNPLGDYIQIGKKKKTGGALEEGTEIKERGNRMLRRSLLDATLHPPFHNELIDPSNWANPRAGTGHHALRNRSDREQERENERDGRKRGTFAGTRGGCHEKVELFRV